MKYTATAIIVIAALAAAFFFYEQAEAPTGEGTEAIEASFACANGTHIDARFIDEAVELTLSDGRSETLPRAISASGARYANADESLVFWNKGDTAFIQEGDATTYRDCVVAQ